MSGTQRITYTQEWDAGHRLMVVTATVGGVTRFAYDGDSTRVQQVHASGTTLYLGAVALTLSPTGRITRTYYFVNGQRIALREQRSDGMVVYFLHADALGSASLGTGLTGTALSSLRYTPYGLPRGETGRLPTLYRYTGQREMGAGFYDYQARLYDPAVGRFVQADTLVPEAGRPQSLNRYVYALNNPVRYTDPSGHWYYDPGLDAIVTTKEPYNEHPEYLKLGPILPNPQQTFRKQVLSSLLAAGPICQQSAIYIVKNNVEFSFSKQKNTGARWTLRGDIALNSNAYSLQTGPTDGMYIGMLGLIVHETKHLEQGPIAAVTVEGEVEGWTAEWMARTELKNPIPSLLWQKVAQTPSSPTDSELRNARAAMQSYAGSQYAIWACPLRQEYVYIMGWASLPTYYIAYHGF